MKKLKAALKKAKELQWQNATVSFYIVRRKLVQREARYEALGVNIDDALAKKLKGIVRSRIEHSNAVRAYDFNTCDLDDDVLGIETSETDLEPVIQLICGPEELPNAQSYSDLVGSWLYIARVDAPNMPPLYAVRKVSAGWAAKKVVQLVNAIFEGNMLIDLERKEIFNIDSKIDFFSFDGVLFVADKKNFETALNFREGMERNRDAIVEEFKQLGIFGNAEDITELIGNNVNRLRKLSQVKNSGYYRDEKYMSALRQTNESEGWNLVYDGSEKLVASEEKIEDILTFLNNDRLSSKINNENFDVDVKRKLGAS